MSANLALRCYRNACGPLAHAGFGVISGLHLHALPGLYWINLTLTPPELKVFTDKFADKAGLNSSLDTSMFEAQALVAVPHCVDLDDYYEWTEPLPGEPACLPACLPACPFAAR